jgi:peptidoglycan glycosyltransferase
MKTPIIWLARGFILAFVVIVVASGYWGVGRSAELLTRPDNPRLVLAEQIAQRGEIFDRNGVVLATNLVDETTGFVKRNYPYPSAAPIVGYYSLQYGTGELEASQNDWLRGDAFTSYRDRLVSGLLHRITLGGDIQTTIDINLQAFAANEMDGHSGAIIVLDASNGEILAMVSSPTFDPNQLDDAWDDLINDPEGPLLNRPLRTAYQPGTILQSVLLAGSINNHIVGPTVPWNGTTSALVSGGVLTCAEEPVSPIKSLGDAFVWSCPRPFQIMGLRMGKTLLISSFDDFGLLSSPQFDLPVQPTDESSGSLDNIELSSVGQSNLLVSPMHMALVAASIANNGEMPSAYVIEARRKPNGDWETLPPPGNAKGTVSPETASNLQSLMRDSVISGAAHSASIDAAQVSGHVGLALAGPENTYNSWFIGFIQPATGRGPIAICVLLDGEANTYLAAQIGGKVLQRVFELSQ